ncbi:7816_t:CDS:2, partial [Dentiscutata heterogama]
KVADKLTVGEITPYSIFRLFFSDLQLTTIVKNTNYYAIAKSAGKGREWISLTIEELLICDIFISQILKQNHLNYCVWNLVEESLEMGQNLHTWKKIAMIQSGLQENQDLQRSFYVTKKFDLPIERLHPRSHYPVYRSEKERGSCV